MGVQIDLCNFLNFLNARALCCMCRHGILLSLALCMLGPRGTMPPSADRFTQAVTFTRTFPSTDDALAPITKSPGTAAALDETSSKATVHQIPYPPSDPFSLSLSPSVLPSENMRLGDGQLLLRVRVSLSLSLLMRACVWAIDKMMI